MSEKISVSVSIFVKNAKKEDVTVDIKKQSVSFETHLLLFADFKLDVAIKLSTGSEYQLDITLADAVIPEQSKFEVLSTKVEIKLQKANASKWPTLELKPGTEIEQWGSVYEGGAKPLSYPSSSKHKVDFDKVKVEEEKLEGDAALNQVFSQIYKGATDEQRMAMMKSFEESGGTVLSTNWDEVRKEKVKGSAPNGMVMKQWSDIHHGSAGNS